MASYSVAADEKAAHAKTLVASTVDTVSFADPVGEVEVVSLDGTSPIYFTVDGTAPTVAGANTYVLPAAIGGLRLNVPVREPTVVRLISAGTPTYSVSR